MNHWKDEIPLFLLLLLHHNHHHLFLFLFLFLLLLLLLLVRRFVASGARMQSICLDT
jgi:hypothetical protein